jgi:hypothetical protein
LQYAYLRDLSISGDDVLLKNDENYQPINLDVYDMSNVAQLTSADINQRRCLKGRQKK